jgi:hypothetical protein
MGALDLYVILDRLTVLGVLAHDGATGSGAKVLP